jgi:hypothetical protein
MSNFVVALLFGIGIGGWIYNKTYRRTGGNRPTSWTVGGIVGVIAMIVFWTILILIF